MDTPEIKQLIKDWHNNKAKNEQDPYFRFMCHWICFNAWLDHESGQATDRKMINWLKQQSPASSDLIKSYEQMKQTTVGLRELKNLTNYLPITDPRGSRPVITISDVNDRDNIIEAIYKIRCNLFHGSKSPGNSKDKKLVSCVNLIMTKWIGDLVAGF